MTHKIIRIGRSSNNDIILNHPSISRRHAELFYDSMGNVFLTDLNSSNGTFVNGKRITGSVQLNQYDIVKLGVADIIPWRNYLEGSSVQFAGNNTQYQPTYEEIQPVHPYPPTTPKRNSNTWKTVTITLSVLVVVGLIAFSLNESDFLDNKPQAIDPNKPNSGGEQPEQSSSNEITYDFSCLKDKKDGGSTEVIDVLEGVDSEMTNALGGEVSIEEEENLGNELYNQLRQENQFIENGKEIENLRTLLTRLTKEIKEPKGYHYQIYLLDDDQQLNAFTAGAKIYVTSRMYKFCESNDELACVIGHEINHNELGHIKQHIQKERLLGAEGAGAIGLLTVSFGQKKETHCDMTGIDLAIAAGYNGCVNIGLWKRMKDASQEGDYNAVENLFRSHPYSEKRANCSKSHIKNNYKFDCETIEPE